MSSAESAIPKARSWHRFTIGGLMIFMLGFGAALAGRNLPFGRPSSLQLCFATWFVIGMVESVAVSYRRWRDAAGLLAEMQRGRILLILWPAFCAGLVAASLGLRIAKELDWLSARNLDLMHSLGISHAIDGMFYLGVVRGYLHMVPAGTIIRRGRTQAWKRIIDFFGVCVGLVWLGIVLTDATFILMMVETAIRGILNGLPYARSGVVLVGNPTFTIRSDQLFAWGSLAAAGLALALFAVLNRMQRSGENRLRQRQLAALWCVLFGFACLLLGWLYADALPRFSPIWPRIVGRVPPINLLLWLGMAVIGSGIFAARGLAYRRTSLPAEAEPDPGFGLLLHQRLPVMLLFLLFAAVATLEDSSDANLWNEDEMPPWRRLPAALVRSNGLWPSAMLRLAAIVVVGSTTWNALRGRRPTSRELSVGRGEFPLVMLMWLLTLAVTAPLLIWFCMGLVLWV